jgi:hypothetical protein
MDNIVDELVERYRPIAFPLSGKQIGLHGGRLELFEVDRGVSQLQTPTAKASPEGSSSRRPQGR